MDLKLSILLCCCLLDLISSWNIGTKTAVIFKGESRSYFGFSVTLHENNEGILALITAPKGNSTTKTTHKLHQPGIIKKCNIINTKCEEIIWDQIEDKLQDNYEYGVEDDMWLGVTVDNQMGEPGYVVVCGHLWKNESNSNYHPLGVCHLMNKDLNRSVKLVPFLQYEADRGEYGQAGMSVCFSEDNKDLLIGSPGFNYWIGGVVNYKFVQNTLSLKPVIPYPPRRTDSLQYIGYSVTTGKFSKFGDLTYVVGAPKDGKYRGKVYMFTRPHINTRRMQITEEITGQQVGEYFGASVLGVDLNSDSNTDLLVGAPLHSLPSGSDEGAVYVYINTGEGLQLTVQLLGSEYGGSRFGTSIANAGDINQDGYLDVVIGAPYEMAKGAIYIYHGRYEGINQKFVQRIVAEDISPLLSGFGISVSRGRDVDSNQYPDLLVGSYTSDNALLLRTHPIVQMSAKIIFTPSQINPISSLCKYNGKSVPCFNATYCLRYTGYHVPQTLGVSVELNSSRQTNMLYPRKYLLYQKQLVSSILLNVTVKKDDIQCFGHNAFIANDLDYLNPIQMALTFWLTHDVTKETAFCKMCPVLDPNFPNMVKEMIIFYTGCGKNNTCVADLKLKANLSGLSSDMLLIGQDNVIILTIEVENLREPAYLAELRIFLPPDVHVINLGTCRQIQDIVEAQTTLICLVGNPFQKTQQVKYEIKLDTSQLSTKHLHLRQLNIFMNTTTASEEYNPQNNQINITIPLKASADVTIVGRTNQEQILLGADKFYEIIHIYNVIKYLPTSIHSVSIEILVPTSFSKTSTEIEFFQFSIGINNDGSSNVPASCNATLINSKQENNAVGFTDSSDLSKRRQKKSTDSNKKKSTESKTKDSSDEGSVLNCKTALCTSVICAAGPFTQNKKIASFHIYGSFNITAIQSVLDIKNNVTIISRSRVSILGLDKNIQPEDHRPDETEVSTVLIQPVSMRTQKIASWILPVSIASGIILFVLILIAMIKIGFFRRKNKELMEQLLQEAKLQQQGHSNEITDE